MKTAPGSGPVVEAYAGRRANFERAGFVRAADTSSRFAGRPRVGRRKDLRTGTQYPRTAAGATVGRRAE